MGHRTRAVLAGLTATTGITLGAIKGADMISGPWRPDIPYTFTPFEVQAEADPVSFVTGDGLRLSGWWFDRPDSNKVVIGAHAYHGTKADMLGVGAGLWRAGFSVLLFDFRGNGDSQDGPQSLAHYEQRDLEAAIDYAAARRPDAEIDLLGMSMGAAVSILVAARDPRVGKVIADSSFADMRGVIRAAAANLRLPPFPAVDAVDLVTGLRYGYRFSHVRPVDVVARIAPRPLLLFHGSADTVTPVDHARRLAAAAGENAELHISEGAGHCGTYFEDRPGYIAFVAEWLSRD